jgi:hypothetical protein
MMHDAVLDISMLNTAEGGRKGPTPPKQFGCIFEMHGKYYDCRLDLSEVGPLSPGQRATVPVAFLHPKDVLPYLSKGDVCSLREARTIASVRISRIVAVPKLASIRR